MKLIEISDDSINQRLDKFLLKYFNKAGKPFIYKMLRKKRIKYNGKRAEGNEILKSGDILSLYLSDETINSFKEEKIIKRTNINFSVLYEDVNILICNKPVGIVSQPDKNNKDNSLNDQILYYLYEKGEIDTSKDAAFVPSICNRLDRNTGGIVLFGKNLAAVQEINGAIKNNDINKFYITAVSGKIENSGKFKAYHIKKEDNKAEIFNEFVEGSKEIVTEYKPIAYKDGYTILEVKLITGKSHQIRAGFKHMGHCIIGDKKYGDFKINDFFKKNFKLNNQFLYAYKVEFKNFGGNLSYLSGKTFKAPLEKNMVDICFDFFGLKL